MARYFQKPVFGGTTALRVGTHTIIRSGAAATPSVGDGDWVTKDHAKDPKVKDRVRESGYHQQLKIRTQEKEKTQLSPEGPPPPPPLTSEFSRLCSM